MLRSCNSFRFSLAVAPEEVYAKIVAAIFSCFSIFILGVITFQCQRTLIKRAHFYLTVIFIQAAPIGQTQSYSPADGPVSRSAPGQYLSKN